MSCTRGALTALLPACLLVCQLSAGSHQEVVLFPFDDHSLPFSKGLLLQLVTAKKGSVNHGRPEPIVSILATLSFPWVRRVCAKINRHLI